MIQNYNIPPSHNQIQINTTGHKIIFASALVHQPGLDNLPPELLKEAAGLLALHACHTPFGPAVKDFILERGIAVEQQKEHHPESDKGRALETEHISIFAPIPSHSNAHQPARRHPTPTLRGGAARTSIPDDAAAIRRR